ncbi:NAD-dependent epimerase/dehydratase family protein [Cellulosimicrobium sp. MI9406]|uniref:NAD-dependent epimerase/dehydratase family protein n=1 Tax=Cellulosimicrobium sp. MI9406 TaxID=2931398 RepID=UPI0033A75FFC
MRTDPPTLVVGARGLLGSAVRRRAAVRGLTSVPASVDWSEPSSAVHDLSIAVDELLRDGGDGRWNLVWAAGAGVTASTDDALGAENAVMQGFVDDLVRRHPHALRRCTLFFASSAGGVYAGAGEAPFTERTLPAPLAPYGRAKLVAESIFSGLSEHGASVVLGRISNLYGPGQNLAKPQGLISQLCLAHHLARPIGIYVSLDTLRDYIYVDDCADLVLDVLDRAVDHDPGRGPVTKILASQSSVTIAAIIGELRTIYKRKPQAVLAASPLGARQARDLRFRSLVWPDLDARALTPLPVGIAATGEDIGRALRRRGPS